VKATLSNSNIMSVENEVLEIVRNLRPIDDTLMRELFRDRPELTEFVLRIFLGKDDLKVVSQETQYDLRIIGERSLELDVFATDSNGKKYNIEVQKADNGATPKRARYHSSAIDVDNLKPQQDFSDLPETYVIFVTENDMFEADKPIYLIERINTTTGKPFGDEEHIIYVNGTYNNENDNSNLARLIHDFKCSRSSDMYHKQMAKVTQECKETEKGEVNMCKAVNDYATKVAKRTAERVAEENSEEIALAMIADGNMSYEKISQFTKLPIDKIRELAEGKPA